MNIVRLDPNLLEVNGRIVTSQAMPAVDGIEALSISSAPFSGTVCNGYDEVTAQITPGSTGTIELSFDIVALSISSSTFDGYRELLKKILKDPTEENIAQSAGIGTAPPPTPSSRMASYARQLFSDVVFGGEMIADQNRKFSAQDCISRECKLMLTVMRLLPVTKVKFSGTLKASTEQPAPQQVAAYIPITAIEFGDGLTIPFAGYSDNVLVAYQGLRLFEIPLKFWSDLADHDASDVDTS